MIDTVYTIAKRLIRFLPRPQVTIAGETPAKAEKTHNVLRKIGFHAAVLVSILWLLEIWRETTNFLYSPLKSRHDE